MKHNEISDIVYCGPGGPWYSRPIDDKHHPVQEKSVQLSFADESPMAVRKSARKEERRAKTKSKLFVQMISHQSVEDIQANCPAPARMEQFRPNLTVNCKFLL